MRFLIVFDPSCSEDGSSVSRVISEFTLCRCFEVRVIASQFIVGIDLIQSILIAEELILSEAHVISFGIEFIGLFSREGLTATSGMVPMVVFQHILGLFIDNVSVLE